MKKSFLFSLIAMVVAFSKVGVAGPYDTVPMNLADPDFWGNKLMREALTEVVGAGLYRNVGKTSQDGQTLIDIIPDANPVVYAFTVRFKNENGEEFSHYVHSDDYAHIGGFHFRGCYYTEDNRRIIFQFAGQKNDLVAIRYADKCQRIKVSK